MPDNDRVLVYSTDGSLPLPNEKRPNKASAKNAHNVPPDDGVIRVGYERRRAGSMTLIYGIGETNVHDVAKDLKQRCGTGGSVKAGVLALQGDHRDAVLAYFAERRRRAKRMGG